MAPNATAKAVLICLADYADANGVAWPAIPRLAREVQASDRTVQRALRALEAAGLLITEKRNRQDQGQTSNGYRIAMTPGDNMTPAPVTECHPPGDTSVTPPVTPVSPPYEQPLEPSPSDEGERRARKAYPTAFEEVWAAYPDEKKRSSKPKSLDAWRALPSDERKWLVAAIGRFAAHVEDACGGKGAPALDRWLRDGKHLNWRDDEAAADPVPVAPFAGPPELRQAVVTAHGEPYARSYLDPCRWDAQARAVIPSNDFAGARLRTDLAQLAERWRFSIGNPGPCRPVLGAAA